MKRYIGKDILLEIEAIDMVTYAKDGTELFRV
jgi:hypothetical protein